MPLTPEEEIDFVDLFLRNIGRPGSTQQNINAGMKTAVHIVNSMPDVLDVLRRKREGSNPPDGTVRATIQYGKKKNVVEVPSLNNDEVMVAVIGADGKVIQIVKDDLAATSAGIGEFLTRAQEIFPNNTGEEDESWEDSFYEENEEE